MTVVDTFPTPVQHTKLLWITKWVDYSNKYGFGYQFSDGSVGILFNDTTRMTLLTDGKYVYHFIWRVQIEFVIRSLRYFYPFICMQLSLQPMNKCNVHVLRHIMYLNRSLGYFLIVIEKKWDWYQERNKTQISTHFLWICSLGSHHFCGCVFWCF